ncbi:MAG: alpha/beta hydrolase [Rhizobiaceae bacterium]|nr:alpha/beta hydrolase [Rhizobiaceae bacterium]
MITRRQIILSASSLAATTSLGFSTSATAGVTKGISYGDNLLDVYSPNGKSGLPIMMFVHGGAWALGNRGQVGRKPKFFNRAGFVFASVGYSLYPKASAETQAMQIGQAVSHMRANAERYGGDPDRIILMGHSAGCHLATLATLSGSAKGVRGIICNDTGAYDLFYLAKVNGGSLPVIYAAPFRKRKLWTRWSPITYTARHAGMPLFVPWSGGKNRDRITANFISSLRKNGANVTPFNGSSYSHGSINTSIGKNGDRLTSAIMDFVSRTLA